MVLCVVVGCSKRSGRDKDVSFYRIPKIVTNKGGTYLQLSKKRRAGFLSAISRDDITEKILTHDRICSRHFISGKPAALEDELNPDWLPTLNLGHSKWMKGKVRAAEERWERKKARDDFIARNEAAQGLLLLGTVDSLNQQEVEEGISIQTDLTSDMIMKLQVELADSYSTIQMLKSKITRSIPFSDTSLQSDEVVRFYTGLPNFQILKSIFEFVEPPAANRTTAKLTLFQEFMVVMVKLRLDTPLRDLAYRFDVSVSTISRIVLKWLTIMDVRLRPLVLWPEREALQKAMPQCFQVSFGTKVAVILDCFEVFIERPSNLLARSCTWSSYKHHNTIKVLLGITPQGVVSYVSEAWGGRTSDKYLTEHCGILGKLLPGDVVLADRGFDISESVGTMQARLHIPAFTRGKDQLSALEIEETRSIANVRIHVERVIGAVRQKYTILQSTLPIDFVTCRSGEDCPLIDRIVRVCCALNNVCDSVIPFD